VLLPAAGCLILGLLLVCFAGTSASTLPALFPTHIRYGALSISFNVSVSLFGGTTPLIASALVEKTHNDLIPAYYLIVAGLVGLVSTFYLRETAGRPLIGSGPMVETEEQARSVVAHSRTEAGRWARDMWIRVRHPRWHPPAWIRRPGNERYHRVRDEHDELRTIRAYTEHEQAHDRAHERTRGNGQEHAQDNGHAHEGAREPEEGEHSDVRRP
jgi:hypothetical protein